MDETNKEEALRCLKIAKNQFGSKNYEAAVRLTKKSLALYSTEEAKEFLAKAKEKAASGESTGSSTSVPQQQEQEKTTTSEKPSPKQQSAEVKEILACSTDYYKVLKVTKNCNEVDIKKSYRKVGRSK
jgi:DnaJ family protein B protein 12